MLCGQPELAERLNQSSLRQLKQRLALRCELLPFSLPETASYVAGRLRIAGGAPAEVFSRDAVIAIHEASSGIPRTINVIADNALIGGFARPAETGLGADRRRDPPRFRHQTVRTRARRAHSTVDVGAGTLGANAS